CRREQAHAGPSASVSHGAMLEAPRRRRWSGSASTRRPTRRADSESAARGGRGGAAYRPGSPAASADFGAAAFFGQLDGSAEGARGSLAVVRVELFSRAVVRQHELAHACPSGDVTSLAGTHVATLGWVGFVLARVPERRFAHEQVGVSGCLDELWTRSDVGRKDQRLPRAAADAHGMRGDVVLHRMEGEAEVPYGC